MPRMPGDVTFGFRTPNDDDRAVQRPEDPPAMTRTIAELIDAEIRCSPVSREQEKITEVHSPLTLPAHRPAATIYEYEVFNFLVSNKRRLGIQRVLKFENLIIDGAIVLDDG